MVILAVTCFLSLAVYEFIPLYKQKIRKDLLVNIVLWAFSFIIAILISMNVDIPSPATPIREAVTSLFGR